MFSVVIPMRDEPDPESILGEVHEALEGINDRYEVIVVRGDKEKLNNALPLFPNQREIKTYADTLERSILTGFSVAQGERIAAMDADGSHPPEMLPMMWRLLDDYEMVVGSRFVDGSEFRGSPHRRLVTWLCKNMAHEAGSKLMDPMSGFFAFRREVLGRCRFRPLTWKPCLEVELRAHPRIKEIPIEFEERRVGKSKTKVSVGLRIMAQLMTEGLSEAFDARG